MPISLPEVPRRMRKLRQDERGYPVPYFVRWFGMDGKPVHGLPGEADRPDFRYADQGFRWLAFHKGLCWLCGEPTGTHKVYVIGPMCVVNRATSEPACHRDCAEFAAKACPFLVHPREKRNDKGLGPEALSPGGIMIRRNPGCVALYETPEAEIERAPAEHGGGWIIRLGAPSRVDWWAEGRQATRAEVMASIESGYPILFGMASKEGMAAIDELGRMHVAAMQFLPAAEA
jgi:hypothetical protein